MKSIVVGSLESSDCLITISPHHTLEIVIESPVYQSFGKQIESVIQNILNAFSLTHVKVYCQDKGALDYTIEARLITAIERFKEAENES